MRRFYAPPSNFVAGHVTLDMDETRHLRDVLRLRKGDKASVFDGTGKEYLCRIEEVKKTASRLSILEPSTPAAPESDLDLTLAAAILKGEKFDLVVQKAVELGVYKLVPLQSARGDVKLKDAGKRLDRWRRIALEATKQCGRARLMDIEPPQGSRQIVNSAGDRSIVMFSERDGDAFASIKKSASLTVMIGPEGGWDDEEIDEARREGAQVITLGGRILRAETAAIAMTAIIQHRFGDLS